MANLGGEKGVDIFFCGGSSGGVLTYGIIDSRQIFGPAKSKPADSILLVAFIVSVPFFGSAKVRYSGVCWSSCETTLCE